MRFNELVDGPRGQAVSGAVIRESVAIKARETLTGAEPKKAMRVLNDA